MMGVGVAMPFPWLVVVVSGLVVPEGPVVVVSGLAVTEGPVGGLVVVGAGAGAGAAGPSTQYDQPGFRSLQSSATTDGF